MACGGTTKSVQKRLTALSSTQVVEWFVGWMSASGMDEVMPVLKAGAATSQYFEAQIVMQTAKVRTDMPEGVVALGSVQTPSSGVIAYNPGVLDISADTGPAMFVRFGVAYKFTSGQAQAAAEVDLEVAWVRCGEVAGSGTYLLSTTTVDDQFALVTGWLQSILVQQVKLSAICTSLTGNFRWRLAYRTAATSQASPGAWSLVTDANAPYTSGERCTGDLSVSLGATMWVQFAILYDLSSAGSGQAELACVIAVRRT
jgi:hypothetical protein